jgi:AraC-like DNA-binding protein
MLGTAGVAIDHRYGATHAHLPEAQAPAVIQRFHDPVTLLREGAWETVAAGTCLVTTAGAALPHRSAGRPFATDWMIIAGPLAEVAERCGCPLATPIPGPPLDAWRVLVDGIDQECWRRERDWAVVVDHRLHDLLILLARAARAEAPADAVVEGVRRRILRELDRPWTVADMAAFAGLSRPRFAARFRRAYGISPLEDLIRVRIRFAQHLLRNTGMPIAAVAVRAGFRDLPWFHRCFRRRTGRTPQQTRQR